MREDYRKFLESKAVRAPKRGLSLVPMLAEHLFNFQAHSVAFALEAGCSGLFLDTGLGKTEQIHIVQVGARALDASLRPVDQFTSLVNPTIRIQRG